MREIVAKWWTLVEDGHCKPDYCGALCVPAGCVMKDA